MNREQFELERLKKDVENTIRKISYELENVTNNITLEINYLQKRVDDINELQNNLKKVGK